VRMVRATLLVCLCFWFLFVGLSYAQSSGSADEVGKPQSIYAPRNSWGIFGESSPNSSHIFLGIAQQRRLLLFGGEYAHRFHTGDTVVMDFLVQARPVILESDPALLGFRNISTGKVEFPITPLRVQLIDHTHFVIGPGDIVVPFYTRQWTYAGGLNPFGIKMNFRPRHRLQPVVTGAGGFVISRRDIPVDHAAAFNFSFELGAGLEWFFQPKRSFRLDYHVHHISNAETGTLNPGIDSGLFQLTYSFGK
jgi:lipid A 3-O-deacylase PagL